MGKLRGVSIERDREINNLEQNLFKTISELLPKPIDDVSLPSINQVGIEQAIKELLELEKNDNIIH